MSALLRKTLTWSAGGLLAVSLVAVMVVAAILGTETGTRWAIHRAIPFIPGRLEVDEVNGTLLSAVEATAVRYSDDGMALTVEDLHLNVSWGRSGPRQIVLQALTAGQVSWRRGESGAGPEPLSVSMPPLPVGISIDTIEVGAVDIGDFLIDDIAVSGATLEGNRVTVAEASARFAGIDAGIADFSAALSGDVELRSTFRWNESANGWRGGGMVRGSLASLRILHNLLAPHPVRLSGTIELLGRTQPFFDLEVEVARWLLDEWTAGPATLRVRGTADRYDADLVAAVSHDRFSPVNLSGRFSGDLDGVDIHELTAAAAVGRASASGALAWSPGLGIDVRLTMQGLDPSAILPVAPGSLDGNVSLAASALDSFVIDVETLDGDYAGQPVSARGRLAREGARYRCESCNLAFGNNHAAFAGGIDGQTLSLDFVLEAPQLGQILPDLSGSLNGEGRLTGSLGFPHLTGAASGRAVAWKDWAVERFDVRSRRSTVDEVDVEARIDGLSNAGTLLGGGEIRLAGKLDAVRIDADWTAEAVSATFGSMIALEPDRISGSVLDATVAERFSGTWVLSDPFEFSVAPDQIEVAAHAWVNGDARLTQSRLTWTDKRFDLETSLVAVPLALTNAVLPETLELDGVADVRLEVSREDDVWRGTMDWSQRDTLVRLSPSTNEAFEVVVPRVEVEVRLANAGAVARAVVEVEPGFGGSLEAAIDELSPDGELLARIRFEGSEWDWVPVLFPEVDEIEGVIRADIDVRGKLRAPDLRGDLVWQDGQLAIPALNVPLSDVELTVSGSSAGTALLQAQATAGEGTLSLDGSFEDITGPGRSFEIRLQGDSARLLNWQGYRLSASPDLTATGNADGLSVTGTLDVDEAEIEVRELPEGAVSLSDDVVVSGELPQSGSEMPVTADVRVVLSEKVQIQAFGLDSGLEGELLLRQLATGDATANGELRLVDGFFEAYGQRLEIEQGTLIFTGPLDDPIIDVRAVRTIEGPSGTVTAGINLRGRARNPSSTLFSSPAMSDTDTLSYLVIGRPLEDVSQAEGRSLSDSAFALGLGQAAFITNQIGQSLGLDQLDVAGSNQNTASLVAGKQLNPRLYARYAFGVFSQVGRLLLRYQLSEHLTVELGAGESQSMDLLYILERQ